MAVPGIHAWLAALRPITACPILALCRHPAFQDKPMLAVLQPLWMSLARLWQQQDKKAEARALLAPRSMIDSPQALIPKICKRPRRCWRS
jgi:hypothetical protein